MDIGSASSAFPASSSPSRRKILRAAAAAATLAAAGLVVGRVWGQDKKKVILAWSQSGYCHAPIPVAFERGIFARNGLEVESLIWSGSTDQLLEALATGKADVGVGLIHRWLKPLEAGLDVKVVGSVHGGCLRLVGVRAAGVTDETKLAGKVIGVSDLNSPSKNFFDIHLARKGVKNYEFRVYPADLLDQAVVKGEIQAIADGDPNLFLLEKRNPGVFVEIGNSALGEYADKVCCVVAVSGGLLRKDKPAVASVVRAITQAADFVADNPSETARIYAKYTPKVSEAELRKLIHATNYRHHPTGVRLREDVEYFARGFREAGILKKTTDPARFASHITEDVLG